MALPEFFDKKLFSINYIAKVCNLSRATIMRFENDGLLTPAYIDPESGYRYYSSDNVAQVIDILKFQHLGFTKKEIKELKSNPANLEIGLNRLKMNYKLLLREIWDMTSKIEKKDTIQIRSFKTLGGNFFKKTREIIYTPQNLRSFVMETLEEFISRKYIMKTSQTMKAYISDADYKTSIGQFDGKKHICNCIIPLDDSQKDKQHFYIKPYNALTLVCQCDYNKSEELFWKLWNEAKSKGLQNVTSIAMAGFPDILFTVDPITNQRSLRLILITK